MSPCPLRSRASRSVDRASHAEPSRPESLQLHQSAAERFTHAEHDLYYPTVSGVRRRRRSSRRSSQVPGHYGAVGINVNIPVFNGGLFKARESEASLKAKAAAQNVADLANRITRDVRVAWLNANTASNASR